MPLLTLRDMLTCVILVQRALDGKSKLELWVNINDHEPEGDGVGVGVTMYEFFDWLNETTSEENILYKKYYGISGNSVIPLIISTALS